MFGWENNGSRGVVHNPNGSNLHESSGNRRSSRQAMHQVSSQKLVQDQNYSNEILFHVLSAIESLLGEKDKLFKHYDRVDFSHKNMAELKSQLQTQVMIFSASRQGFNRENPHTQWRLPNNFTEQDCRSFLNESIARFESLGQKDCAEMARDVLKILDGHFSGLFIDSHDFSVKYSQQEEQKFKKDLARNGMYAGQEMEKRAKEVENVNDPSDLHAHLNPQHRFHQGKNGGKEKEEPMEVEHTEQRFFVFQAYSSDVAKLKKHLSEKVDIKKLKATVPSSKVVSEKNEHVLREMCRQQHSGMFQSYMLVSFTIDSNGKLSDKFDNFKIVWKNGDYTVALN